MKNKVNILRKTTLLLVSLFTISAMVSCVGDELFRDDLPDSNSQVDTQLPEANFAYSADEDDFTLIYFQDLSSESNSYMWDFGGGDTSTEQDPTYTFVAGEGTYPVTLTTSDSNGAMSSITIDVIVAEPEEPEAIIPEIGGWEFESSGNSDLCPGDSRDCWRIDGETIHQTSSNGDGGTRSAKYPPGNDLRASYQAITVSPNTSYILKFRYSIRVDGVGDGLIASVIDGQLDNFSEFESATLLAQAEATEPTGGVDSYADFSLPFETGANGQIALLFNHTANVDNVWLDNVEIELGF
ncbi:PKD domain-containing protein [Psychroserpens algicola]|uniref:PKD domain-containing protein n=1 Tax=Psychroserpens algicola TaxID=1719034 RepID=UPI001954FD15|nr:PKD domain-containing protein [Psychroserpens algicola]